MSRANLAYLARPITLIFGRSQILSSFLVAIAFGLTACGGGGGGGGSSGSSATPPTSPTGASLQIIAVSGTIASIPKGLTTNYTATGVYSDGTTKDLTSSVNWNSSNTTAATVDATGMATGVGVGSTYITASSGAITSLNAPLTITPAELVSIEITPVSPTIGAGQTSQFTAVGTYTDSTTQDITSNSWWSSSDTNIANINSSYTTPAGLATAVNPGTVTITVTDPNTGINATTSLIVSGYSVGGKESLLPPSATVTVQNNGMDDLVLTNTNSTPVLNVPFIFNTPLASGSTYDVSVLTQPTGGTHPCNVVNGRGTITSTYITSVKIVCDTAVGTVAGTANVSGSSDGTGISAQFNNPSGIAFDATTGNLYVADTNNHLIRMVTPDGVVTTLAGTGVSGFANGTGTNASFKNPSGIAVDSSGNIYVADTGNNAIRKISMPGAVVSTWAGSGAAGSTNATGTSATFYEPNGVAVDTLGNVYVADTYNNLIRKISPSQVVTTFAGTGTHYSLDGAALSASFSYPYGIAVDSSNNVYVADGTSGLIRLISGGQVTTYAGAIMASFNNVSTTDTASFSFPTGLAVDGAGNVYVADYQNHLIRKISGGYVTVYAGLTHYMGSSSGSAGYTDGPAWIDASSSSAAFYFPFSVTVDNQGNVYVADKMNHLIRKIMP